MLKLDSKWTVYVMQQSMWQCAFMATQVPCKTWNADTCICIGQACIQTSHVSSVVLVILT